VAKSGGQPGNKNTFKGNEWSKSLKRAMARLSAAEGDEQVSWRRGLDKAADKVVAAACEGQKDAWQEIANRIEGKPRQGVDLDANVDVNARIEKIVNEIVD